MEKVVYLKGSESRSILKLIAERIGRSNSYSKKVTSNFISTGFNRTLHTWYFSTYNIFLRTTISKAKSMVSLEKAINILNQGSSSYTRDQARVIRDFLVTLSEVEYHLNK